MLSIVRAMFVSLFVVAFVVRSFLVDGWRPSQSPWAASLGSNALSDKLAMVYERCGNKPHTELTIDCTSSVSV